MADARFLRICVCAALVALLALVLRPAEHVYDTPITEDGYYALSVARSLAEGKGFATRDGVPTNGFQPLFTIVEAVAFATAGDDEVRALRHVVFAAWLFHAAGALMISLVAADAWPDREGRRRRAAWAALGYLASPLLVNHAYNGLETGAVLFFHLALARWFQLGWSRSLAGAAGGGVLGGLLVLARIDAAIVVAALAAAECVRGWRRAPANGIARAAAFGAVAALVSAPWFAFNLIAFGSPMPTSGQALQGFALEGVRLEFAAEALSKVLVPWVFLGDGEHLAAIRIEVPWGDGATIIGVPGLVRTGVLVAALAWILRGGAKRLLRRIEASTGADGELARNSLWTGGAMLAGWTLLVAYYTVNFTAYWFYYRYFAPFALIAIVVAAAWLGARHTPVGRGLAFGVAAALCVQHATLLALAYRGAGQFGQPSYLSQVALVDMFVSRFDTVAAGQSGTLGFFRPRVVNLDGKVNVEAIARQRSMVDYLRERGVRWFCDWPHYVNRYLGVALDPVTRRAVDEGNGWRLVAERDGFLLYEDTTRRDAPVRPNPDESFAVSGKLPRGGRRGAASPEAQ